MTREREKEWRRRQNGNFSCMWWNTFSYSFIFLHSASSYTKKVRTKRRKIKNCISWRESERISKELYKDIYMLLSIVGSTWARTQNQNFFLVRLCCHPFVHSQFEVRLTKQSLRFLKAHNSDNDFTNDMADFIVPFWRFCSWR